MEKNAEFLMLKAGVTACVKKNCSELVVAVFLSHITFISVQFAVCAVTFVTQLKLIYIFTLVIIIIISL